jgi:hypothetical protein
MYGGILLFGLVFSLSGHRLRSIPWYLWLLLGVVPIGWDGASQLPSLMGINLPDWLPIRESSPAAALNNRSNVWCNDSLVYLSIDRGDHARDTRHVGSKSGGGAADTFSKRQRPVISDAILPTRPTPSLSI